MFAASANTLQAGPSVRIDYLGESSILDDEYKRASKRKVISSIELSVYSAAV